MMRLYKTNNLAKIYGINERISYSAKEKREHDRRPLSNPSRRL
jgi:hypothetical protein